MNLNIPIHTNVVVFLTLLVGPIFAHADGVIPISGILLLGLFLFMLVGFLLYGIISLLARTSMKSELKTKSNHNKDK